MLSKGLGRDAHEILRLLSHILSTGDKVAIFCMLPGTCCIADLVASVHMLQKRCACTGASSKPQCAFYMKYITLTGHIGGLGGKADACDRQQLDRNGVYVCSRKSGHRYSLSSG